MKMKSILASIGACAIAASAMAISASAAITNANSNGNYEYVIMGEDINNLPDGCKLSDIYGFEAKLSKTASGEESCVGAFCYQSDSNNWAQTEFCQEGGDKNVVIGSDGVVKWVSATPLYSDSDTWAKAIVAEWSWPDDKQIDFAVESIKLLDKDGNELKAAGNDTPAETTAAGGTTTTAAGTTTTAAGTTTTAAGTKTGDAGVGLAVAGVALAGAAAYVARKKH